MLNRDLQDTLDLWTRDKFDAPDMTFPFQDDLRGKHSYLGRRSLRFCWTIKPRLLWMRTENNGLQIMAALELSKLRSKAYPSTLKELDALGVKADHANELSSSGQFRLSFDHGIPQLVIPVDLELSAPFSKGDYELYRYDEAGAHLLPESKKALFLD